MYISSVTIKGMHNAKNVKVNLKPGLTYINGPNGVGKSTILQAIQWALVGFIPGTDKKSSAIFSHANSSVMSVKATIDGGTEPIEITRTLGIGNNGKLSSEVIVSPEHLSADSVVAMFGELKLPIFDFQEFINMSSNKLKEWFLKFLPKSETELDWNQLMCTAVEDLLAIPEYESFLTDEIQHAVESEYDGVDKIRALNDYFKELVSLSKSEVTRAQQTIEGLIVYTDVDDSLDIDELKAECLELTKQIQQKSNELNSRRDYEEYLFQCPAECFKEDTAYKATESDIAQVTEAKVKYVSELDKLNQTLAESRAELHVQKLINASKGICPFTSKVCDSIADDVNPKREQGLTGQIDELSSKINLYNNKLIDANASISTKEVRLESIRQKYLARDRINASTKTSNELNDEFFKLNEEYNAKIELIDKAASNNSYKELSDKATKEMYLAEYKHECAKRWVILTGPNGIASDITRKQFNRLANNITKRLSEVFDDTTAVFNITEKSNDFSFGILKESFNKYVPFEIMSSGEKCLFTIALLQALIESSDTQIPLMLIDDIFDHVDPNNLNKLFESLYSVKGIQTIVAGVNSCPTQRQDFVIHLLPT